MASTPLIGIYGGTFNPIHTGHLRAAEEVMAQLAIERMIFIPSARPPHKNDEHDDPVAPASDRFAWVQAAVQKDPRFEVDPIEVEREGKSYLVDTLRTLRERFSPARLVFVLGTDAFCEMGSWRQPRALFTLAHFAVTTRPPRGHASLPESLPEGLGADFEMASDGLSARHRTASTWIRLLEIDAIDVSASSVRKRIRSGASVRYLLPETIHDAVVGSEHYL
jgi:nicotinate-nucleotide adenylyltransferase